MSMTPRPGRLPYLWVTHITGLVAGDKTCQYAAWVKAHFYYDKRPDENEGNLLKWKTEHGEMVRAETASLRRDGHEVYVEDQNKFAYRGRTAIVGGKPDIIAYRDVEAPARAIAPGADIDTAAALPQGTQLVRIVDCKTGKERDSDAVQVAMYILLAPHDLPNLRDRDLVGEVRYKHRTRVVTREDAARLRPAIVEQVSVAASDLEPPTTPSPDECRFCDILDCRDRALAVAETDQRPVDGAMF